MITASTQKRDKNANLEPFKFKKGEDRARLSPGRPRTRQFAKFVRELYEENPDSADMVRLVRQMERRCPQELAHYLAGKPVETVAAVDATDENLDALITALARRKAKQGGLIEQR
ncbi:MAG: hypothetical protein WAO02_10640 [Verrucomicrobiia bacterium]